MHVSQEKTSRPITDTWTFQVFVVGRSAPHSTRAVQNLRRVLDIHLPGGYELEIVDLQERPEVAAQEQLIVIPAVVRKLPHPPVRLTGDFSDEDRVVDVFGLGSPRLDPGEGAPHG